MHLPLDISSPLVRVDGTNSFKSFEIKSVNPRGLTDSQITKVHNLMQDIWADGTGEFLRCKICNHIHSKKDIFGHLSKIEYKKTVAELLSTLESSDIHCSLCRGATDYIYGKSNIETLKRKYRNSVNAFLMLLTNDKGEQYGFAEGYVDTFDNIFTNDLSIHYGNTNINIIKDRIGDILGGIPKEMVVFSGIGIRSGDELVGRKLITWIFSLLNNLFSKMEQSTVFHPGIMELDKGHFMHHIFSSCQGISLELDKYIDVSKLQNKPLNYQSDLVIFKNPISIFRKELSSGPSAFFRKNRVTDRIANMLS